MGEQLLLKALRREKVERPPIWLMRQAATQRFGLIQI